MFWRNISTQSSGSKSKSSKGRDIAQAVSRQLPTVAARVRSQVRSRGICGKQSGTGACFLRVLRFPLPILIPPTTPHSSSIIWGCTIGHISVDIPSGLSLTKKLKKKKVEQETSRSRWQAESGSAGFLFALLFSPED
jgi:hypothetical protein